MKKSRPKIGVTGPDSGGYPAWFFTRLAVWRAGGQAIRITPNRQVSINDIDGLILGGGADINPSHYSDVFNTEEISEEKPDKGLKNWGFFILNLLLYPILLCMRKLFSTTEHGTDRKRDDLELPLLNKALARKIPVLGICRGAQLINVYCGGDLHQNLDTFYEEIPQIYTIWPKKNISVTTGSKLYEIIERDEIVVNALHRQAVNKLAQNIIPTAREGSGVIQAIEHKHYSFVIGVQWHPEYLPQVPEQQKLFEALIRRAQKINQPVYNEENVPVRVPST